MGFKVFLYLKMNFVPLRLRNPHSGGEFNTLLILTSSFVKNGGAMMVEALQHCSSGGQGITELSETLRLTRPSINNVPSTLINLSSLHK